MQPTAKRLLAVFRGRKQPVQVYRRWRCPCGIESANFRVPRYLRVIADFEAIGMTASGKVKKAKLREHALKEFGL